MKLKKLVQIMVIGCSILAVSACSTTHKKSSTYGDGAAVGDENGAQTSGIGQGDGFGDQGGPTGANGLSKRTYYFDYDRSDIREADKPAVLANADYLIAHTNTKIILEGHTDPRGSREYNVALGERRANAVLDMLKSRGVNPDQVRVVSYGSEQLAQPGRNEQDYQMDRRVVIVYTQK